MKTSLKPYLKIKTRRSSFRRLTIVAYGYLIYWNRIDKYFGIVHSSILCCIKFKSLKDAIQTAKMKEATHIQTGNYHLGIKRTRFTYVKNT
jgi:hypothetical protein